MLATMPSRARVSTSAGASISTCSKRCRRSRSAWSPRETAARRKPATAAPHRVVTDAVEPGLQARPGAGDDVVGDLVLGQVAHAEGERVRVRAGERRRTRPDGTVDAQIAGQSEGPDPLRPLQRGRARPTRPSSSAPAPRVGVPRRGLASGPRTAPGAGPPRSWTAATPCAAALARPTAAASRRSSSLNIPAIWTRQRWCADRLSSPSARYPGTSLRPGKPASSVVDTTAECTSTRAR